MGIHERPSCPALRPAARPARQFRPPAFKRPRDRPARTRDPKRGAGGGRAACGSGSWLRAWRSRSATSAPAACRREFSASVLAGCRRRTRSAPSASHLIVVPRVRPHVAGQGQAARQARRHLAICAIAWSRRVSRRALGFVLEAKGALVAYRLGGEH
eukprot:scaffold48_cov395-Prasinococcus_capsulatus_cf.AAC.44